MDKPNEYPQDCEYIPLYEKYVLKGENNEIEMYRRCFIWEMDDSRKTSRKYD